MKAAPFAYERPADLAAAGWNHIGAPATIRIVGGHSWFHVFGFLYNLSNGLS